MNLAQCRLKSGDYYEAITHTTEVIEHRPDNVKVLFLELFKKCKLWVENFFFFLRISQ